MFRVNTLAVVATLVVVSAASFAQDDHNAHHPAGSASGAVPAPPTLKSSGMPDMAMMDKHMKSMQDMHKMMANAKTSAERQALMAEHTRLMREGMSIMEGLSSPNASSSAAARAQMMERRMDMMQSMMQMMMDRLPKSPAEPAK